MLSLAGDTCLCKLYSGCAFSPRIPGRLQKDIQTFVQSTNYLNKSKSPRNKIILAN